MCTADELITGEIGERTCNAAGTVERTCRERKAVGSHLKQRLGIGLQMAVIPQTGRIEPRVQRAGAGLLPRHRDDYPAAHHG